MRVESREHLPSLRARVRTLMAVTFVVIGAIAVLAGASFVRLLDARHVVIDELEPVSIESSRLLTSFIRQETAVRGFALSDGAESFLEPYSNAVEAAEASRAEIRELLESHPGPLDELAGIEDAVAAWREGYAEPTLSGAIADPESEAALERGRELFAAIRDEFVVFQEAVDDTRRDAVDDLDTATLALLLSVSALAAMSVVSKLVLWRTFHSGVATPLAELGEDARAVAGGDLTRTVRRPRHAELAHLGESMEEMRERLVEELHVLEDTYAVLEQQAGELERSNSDLEQFAYVASHDLQEPLRKVISFSQLLQSRYEGQLDERADQYIAYAVDAAKRMQTLINDLLSFSRVGRLGGELVRVDLDEAVTLAIENLHVAIEEADATIERDPLPTILADRALMVSLFQNLLGNAVKFRRPEVAPHITITCEQDGSEWLLRVTDNGIGIDPEFGEKVFVIFQRLHGKESYGGTGIGLAMCRKIVEHHGGRIWIEEAPGPGTRFCLTFPVQLDVPAPREEHREPA